ncbi:MAG: thermonuclease family protein [Nitrospirota bacterium]
MNEVKKGRLAVVAMALWLAGCGGERSLPPDVPLPIGMARAKVVKVLEGDTVAVVSRNGVEQTIRLLSVDCPEADQPFGRESAQMTAELTLGRDVVITEMGRDRSQRILGEIRLADGRQLNRELVSAGACWWSRKYAPDDRTLRELEASARSNRRGLWAGKRDPMPPWEWRKRSSPDARVGP